MLLAEPTEKIATFEDRTPFRVGSEEPLALEATLEGTMPSWLAGSLVRTCPALFATDSWRADHWFDGLGMLYAFRIGAAGVRYQQRLMETRAGAKYRSGNYKPTGFGTRMRRSFLRRIFEPVPEVTDNANVNVVSLGGKLVAMTESSTHLLADPETLAIEGPMPFEADLPNTMMTAHPHFDFARGVAVNVGSRLDYASGVSVFEHAPGSKKRKVVASFKTAQLPYIHSFGLTEKSAVIIGHPYTFKPTSFLWSNKAFIEHITFRKQDGTRLHVLDRASGAMRTFETESMFVFHTAHAYDDGGDTVLDVVAYDDTAIVEQLSRAALARELPTVAPKPLRLRMQANGKVVREPLSDVGFEFPTVHYRHVSGKAHRFVFGTTLEGKAKTWQSHVRRLDTKDGTLRSFHERDWVFGEPVFVGEPGSNVEGRGVLVLVGTKGHESAMLVLDAETLDVHGWAKVPTAIPLGFHGSFVR